MSGSLQVHRGALWVGWHEKTAHVVPFDWGGRALGPGFTFRDPRLGRATVGGLALDDDRNLWVADGACSRIRRFSVFGRELGGFGRSLDAPLDDAPTGVEEDRPGMLGRPTAVLATGDSDGLELVVGSGGTRRHALQLFDGDGVLQRTLRPEGNAHGRFRGLSGLDRDGRFLALAESRADRIQVYRDLDFHFAFRPGPGFHPTDVALLEDGRLLTCGAGGLALFSSAGRPLAHLCEAAPNAPEGTLDEPLALAVEEGESDRRTRIAILDAQATRLQIFNLEGRHYGSFAPTP